MTRSATSTPRPEGRLYLVKPAGRDEPPDERALVAALVRGDTGAAVTTYERFAPLVRRLLRRLLGPARDIDDLVQEVFLRVFEHIDTLANPQALTAFVITCTTHLARSELRKRFVRRFVRPFADDELGQVPGPGADPAAREAVGRFYRVLDRLSTADRTAFVLRFMEELELGDVAAALGVSLATVKRRLDRIWARVGRLVEQDPGLQEYLSGLRGGTP